MSIAKYLANIDWTATGSMLSGIGTIIGSIAVIYAAHKGADTFRQWRKQKGEERRMDLAEQILTLAYKLRRAFEHIRSPGMLAGEITEVEVTLTEEGVIDDDIDLALKSLFVTAQATLSRSKLYKADFEALLDLMPVAKAIFGDMIAEQLNVFWQQRARVTVGANSYARLARVTPPRSTEQEERQFERREKIEAIIWSGGGADGIDPIAVEIDAAIQLLEAQLLPIIRSDAGIRTSSAG